MLIGFVIASVGTCFVSRVLNSQRVNVPHLNDLKRQCLILIQTIICPQLQANHFTKLWFRISEV